MITQIVKIENITASCAVTDAAGAILKAGGLVAFPTETVYGLGANALDKTAVGKIYEAKGRPSDNPLIVHIANQKDVYLYAKDVSETAEKLMAKFWPGPLTLIFTKTEVIETFITGGLMSVAIRLPKNEIARSIINKSGCPIAAPSANRSGKPSPTRAKHVIEDLSGRVDMIVDGGKAQIGLESTVLDVTGLIPIILRPGSVTKEMLESVVGEVMLDDALQHEHAIPKSPGMKYKHYAPKGQIVVVAGETKKTVAWINAQVQLKLIEGHKVAVIATDEDAHAYQCDQIMHIGSHNNPNQIASNLFKLLRQMDEEQVEFIYTRDYSLEGIGMATMNRLMKAAGNQKISL